MNHTSRDLRKDALAIWQAGVAVVDANRLVQETVRVWQRTLLIGEQPIDLDSVRRLIVIGAGKAGAGMVAGLEAALGPSVMRELDVTGWVNVPNDTIPAGKSTAHRRIQLHPARPAGVNEPTEAAAHGTEEMLRLLQAADPSDLCICLVSGGGSALLPAPATGISLEDKLAITRLLSAAGANIQQLNTVRIPLSRVKGGGLATACRAGRLITLLISDVPGDPLELIASGPTVPASVTAVDALRVLDDFKINERSSPEISRVMSYLRDSPPGLDSREASPCVEVTNIVIGNLALAVDAAGQEAERRGYEFAMHVSAALEGEANEVGRKLAQLAVKMRGDPNLPNCLIHGGEPVVTLTDDPGKGGRNQQLALAAYVELTSLPVTGAGGDSIFDDIVVLSGGTDGEDGPTDAAGACIDTAVHRKALEQGLEARSFLGGNDAYRFFDLTGGLLKTGPTGTNVGDLRVVITH
ncbi:MAG: DUF4147 domain-containing protein [Pirellulales bacterium]|nr:DUF4147 domain-containing protein [Pirellulales bacterium]